MLVMICLLCIYFANEIDAAENGRSSFNELLVDRITRSYILYRPMASNTSDLPLMIVLHGGLGNARYMQKSTGMNEIADTGQFIVAYPNGVGGRFAIKNRRTWNAGLCCGRAAKKNVDDVRFIEKMIEDIGSKLSIDTRRIYVAGMSNGAMMAYRLACEIPDRIAAIIAVAGTLAVGNCDAAKDIPVLHIHGTEDKNVPVKGGVGLKSVAGIAHRSVSDTVKLITRSRRCQAPDVRTESGGIQISSYHCANGAPVRVVLISGGGHLWPGGYGKRNKDSTTHKFSASKQAWEFAKQFSKISK
jgi:polyhydroxybutyrate depolymerase